MQKKKAGKWQRFRQRMSSGPFSVVAALLGLTALSVLVTICGNSFFSGLGSNLAAGFLGSMATIFFVDRLAQQRETRRLLPVRAALYEDVRLLSNRALSLRRALFIEGVSGAAPNSWVELLSDECSARTMNELNIAKEAIVMPPMPWSTWFDRRMGEIEKRASDILDRYMHQLEPEVFRAVHRLATHNHYSIDSMRQLDSRNSWSRPTNLGSYLADIPEWRQAVLALHAWVSRTHPELEKEGATEIFAPEKFSLESRRDKPTASFEPGELEAQADKWVNR